MHNFEMHDLIQLGYLGLVGHEVNVLKSIFKLAPKLRDSYQLIEPDHLQNADVVLVSADNPEALNKWNILKRQNELATSIMLSASGESIEADAVLQRPIRIQKLIKALEDIVNERTFIPNPDDSARNNIQVLVVDDSYPVRKYMEHKLPQLVNMPIQLSFASSGEEAMSKIQQNSPEIIFLDVIMEGVDGYKTCKMIKAKHSAYVVMLTSKKSPFDKVRGTMSGCDAYLTKPPSDERLSDEIQKFIKRRSKEVSSNARSSAR